MTDFQSPEVRFTEKRGTPVAFPSISPGVAAFIGVTEKGPVNDPILLYGPDDFTEVFGNFIAGSQLADEVYGFFKNGGERCYVSRVVHYTDVASSATGSGVAATAMLNGTGAVATLLVSSSSPGSFGNLQRVSATRVDTVAGKPVVTVAGSTAVLGMSSVLRIAVGDTVSVTKGGDTQRSVVTAIDPVTKTVSLSPNITVPVGGYDGTENVVQETFTLTPTDADGTVQPPFRSLRMSALAGENYVENRVNNYNRTPLTVDDQGMAVGADNRPLNTTNTLLGTTVAGSNGGTIVDADYVGAAAGNTGLYAYDGVDDFLLGPIIPGITTATVAKGIETYVEGRRDCFGIVDMSQGLTPAQALTWVTTTVGLASSYVATYYPWLRAADYRTGGVSSFAPSGFIAGMYARTFRKRNFGKAPAGIDDGRLLGVLGVDFDVKKPAYDTLYPAKINAIQKKAGKGIVVMGSRTLDPMGDFIQINARIVFLVVKRVFQEATQFALFETSNVTLWSKIIRVMTIYLRGLKDAGVLDGESYDDAFFIQCDAQNNTAAVRKTGKVKCRVGLNVGDVAEFIEGTLEQDTRALDAELALEVG